MCDALAHRGPDGSGEWFDEVSGIALGHRRLAIIDLTETGSQPMTSASGRYVLSFNGEIYNYRELRSDLAAQGHRFRGTSDTEVLLAAFEQWGFKQALRNAEGMLAVALWDRAERRLHLARDRLGEKPLYFGHFDGTFVFASELKAILASTRRRFTLSRLALSSFIRHNYIPAPLSIFNDIRKLEAGHALSVSRAGNDFATILQEYWSVTDVAKRGTDCNKMLTSPEEACNTTHRALQRSVRRQMVADVPIGAFLSGGIDSSLVVALMQAEATNAVHTFTIGFWSEEFNEAPFARAIATHLGTNHTELIVTPSDALDVIPSLSEMYDEPFADSSQIPTYLLSRLTRRSVTVSLSGDGGDELFSGYDRYAGLLSRWTSLNRLPSVIRRAAAQFVRSTPDSALQAAAYLLPEGPSGIHKRQQLALRLRAAAEFWSCRTESETYTRMMSYWHRAGDIVIGGEDPPLMAAAVEAAPPRTTSIQRLMHADQLVYLPDDILTKVDRAAMAASLETRVPMLDPMVIETSWRIPLSVHRRDGQGKWVLRQLLSHYVPTEMFSRPKRGFAVPVAQWLRNELRPWAEDLIQYERLHQQGYLKPELVRQLWQQHLLGQMDWSFQLWGILMFESWMDRWGNLVAGPI